MMRLRTVPYRYSQAQEAQTADARVVQVLQYKQVQNELLANALLK